MFGVFGFLGGFVLIMIGAFLVFFFPTTSVHQPDSMALTGIVIGIIFFIVGGLLLFT